MSGGRDRLLELASRVADGERVDWDAEIGRHPDLAERIGSMRRLAGLATEFARVLESGGGAAEPEGGGGRWGHLELVERIAAGSYGEVWRAFDPVLQREVALKLRREDVGDADSAQSFLHEARRLAKVRHPNILGVHGADIHGGRVGLWSELLEGRTLEAEIEAGGPGAVGRVLELGRDLARALAAVHEAGLVHGDVKASNVAVEPDGRAVLLDFGAGIDLADGFRARASYASPLSAAPERLDGAEPSAAADVWSLGVVLYRVLAAGRYPFEAGDLDGLRELHRRRGDAPVAGSMPAVPRALRRVVDRMLAPEPGDRPSAAEVADRLRWIAHAPLRRRRRGAVAAMVASLVVAVLATGVGYLRATRAAERAELAWRDAEEVSEFLGEVLGAPRPIAGGADVTVLEVLEGAEHRVRTTLERGSTARARILQMLGGTYRALERFEQAEPVLRQAAEELESRYGPSHPRSVRALVELADLCTVTGRTGEAEELLARAAERAEGVAPGHEVHTWLRINQAAVARQEDDLEEAERLLQEARSRRIALAEPRDHARQSVEVTLSELWLTQGRYAEVVELLEPLAVELEETRGMRHRNTLATWNNLAVALTQLNRRGEAYERYARVLEVAEEWMGPDDPLAFAARSNLAAVTKELGRVEEAAAFERRMVATAETTYGPDHPMTLQVRANLAVSLKELGETAEAEHQMDDVARRLAEGLGRNHPLSLLVDVNRAELLLDTGRPREALELADDVRRRIGARLGDGHLFALAADSIAGAARCATGRRSEGVALLEATVEAQHALGGPHDQQALLTRVRLGEALAEAGETAAAGRILEETVARCEASMAPGHPIAARARRARGELG